MTPTVSVAKMNSLSFSVKEHLFLTDRSNDFRYNGDDDTALQLDEKYRVHFLGV